MIHHVRSGRRDGPCLVLVHGFLGGTGYWQPQVEGLGDRFDLVAVDLPGFAGSAAIASPGSIEGLAGCVVQLMDHLGVERSSMLGFSMGGMVAMQAALDHPGRIDRLVLYGTAATGTLPNRFESWDTSIARVNAEGVEATADRTVASWFVRGTEHPSYAACREACRGASREGALAAMRAMQRWSAMDRLQEIRAPALVIVGDKDRSTKPAESVDIWQGIPGAQLCVIPGAAHGLHMEKPELFNRVVAEFLLAA